MNARKGLKRVGMAAYEIAGPVCTMVIRRNGRGCYLVGRQGQVLIPHFCTHAERTLGRARQWAEKLAGV